METWPGSAYPLGATFDGSGTNFALFSESAERVELCLFDEDRVETRIEMQDVDAYVWHCYLPRSSPASGTAIGSTVRTTPTQGQRTNPNKLLLDPYAKAPSARSTGIPRCSRISSAIRLRSTTTTPPRT